MKRRAKNTGHRVLSWVELLFFDSAAEFCYFFNVQALDDIASTELVGNTTPRDGVRPRTRSDDGNGDGGDDRGDPGVVISCMCLPIPFGAAIMIGRAI